MKNIARIFIMIGLRLIYLKSGSMINKFYKEQLTRKNFFKETFTNFNYRLHCVGDADKTTNFHKIKNSFYD